MEELQLQIDALKAEMENLKNSATIPYDIDQSIRTRFEIDALAKIKGSTKSASSENVTVDEAGSNTFPVLGIPDGFDERLDGNTTKFYPYWT